MDEKRGIAFYNQQLTSLQPCRYLPENPALPYLIYFVKIKWRKCYEWDAVYCGSSPSELQCEES